MTQHFLNNRKLSIAVGFGAMFSLAVLVAMAALMWTMGTIQGNLDNVIKTQFTKMHLIAEMRNAARARTLCLSNMLIVKDLFEQDEEYLKFNHNGDKFVRARLQLLQSNLSDVERAMIAQQGTLTGKTVPVQKQVVELIYAGEIEKAQRLLVEQAIPLQNQVMEQLSQLYDLQESASHQTILHTAQSYLAARRWIFISSTTAGLLAVIVVGLIIQRKRALHLLQHADPQ